MSKSSKGRKHKPATTLPPPSNKFQVIIPMMYWVEFEQMCEKHDLEPDKMVTAVVVQFVKNWLALGCPDVFNPQARKGPHGAVTVEHGHRERKA